MKKRVEIFGVAVDPVTREEASALVCRWLKEDRRGRYVVTPNVDHVVRLEWDTDLVAAYRSASLVLVDGKPVRWAANLLGAMVPCTVPGSDLVPSVLERAVAENGVTSVFLFGGPPGSAEQAARVLREKHGQSLLVRHYCPPMGFEDSPLENAKAIAEINSSHVDLLVIGLGMPKQEKWIRKNSDRLNYRVALCVGATIEFIAGVKKRAPKWVQTCALEWLYRAIQEPRRLGRRYAVDAVVFPRIVLKEVLGRLRA